MSYIYDSLDSFRLDVKEFIKLKKKLVLMSFDIEFENYCAKCKIHRYGDTTNVLEVINTYNYVDNEMNIFIKFQDFSIQIENDWCSFVSNFFDSTILPRCQDFRTRKVKKLFDLCFYQLTTNDITIIRRLISI